MRQRLCGRQGLRRLERWYELRRRLRGLLAMDACGLFASWGRTQARTRKVLKRTRRGIQYVEHAEGHGDRMYEAVCKLGLEGIVSKKLDAPTSPGHQRRGSRSRIRKRPQRHGLWTRRSNKASPSFNSRGPNKRRTTDKDRRASRRRAPLVPLVGYRCVWQPRADCKIDWARKMNSRRSRLLCTAQW
jgi:hypothetical protein